MRFHLLIHQTPIRLVTTKSETQPCLPCSTCSLARRIRHLPTSPPARTRSRYPASPRSRRRSSCTDRFSMGTSTLRRILPGPKVMHAPRATSAPPGRHHLLARFQRSGHRTKLRRILPAGFERSAAEDPCSRDSGSVALVCISNTRQYLWHAARNTRDRSWWAIGLILVDHGIGDGRGFAESGTAGSIPDQATKSMWCSSWIK